MWHELKFTFFTVLLFVFAAIPANAALYQNAHAPLEARVSDLLSRLTLEEKVSLLSGDESGFATRAIPRVGLPSVPMTDGPLGVRFGVATAFPAGIAMGATFNPGLIQQAAGAMALESKAMGRDMLLAPCVNLSRHPFGGRNFESFGEDPVLSTQIALGYLKGMQAHNVIPSLKHFALNEQEFKRADINVIADERTMHELHFPAFKALVQAGVWTVMASYNKVNGHWASENRYLLTEVLKEKWGFRGIVVSDWWATHSTVKAAEAGLDLEMPNNTFFAPLLEAVRSRQVSESLIDDKVSRLLRVIFATGLYDLQPSSRPGLTVVGSPSHLKLAEKVAQESIVLLKNEPVKGHKLLPLDSSRLRSVALIGAGAKYSRVNGGGSSMVNPTRVITPLAALRARAPTVEWRYAVGAKMKNDFEAVPKKAWFLDAAATKPGVQAAYFNNGALEGAPALTRVDPTIDFDWGWNSPGKELNMSHFSARWAAYLKSPVSFPRGFAIRADDGVRLFVDGKLLLDTWDNSEGLKTYQVPFPGEANRIYEVRLEFRQGDGNSAVALGFQEQEKDDLAEAVRLAATSDAAILFLGLSRHYEGESFDRNTMALPEGQDELARRVLAANPRTIVVLQAGNPVGMPWINDTAALVHSWYAGQEGGYALADILLGRLNPSGKLPITLISRWEDSPAFGFYPEDASRPGEVTYGEGLYLGYRHFDKKGISPLFPFGFGLSYTSFTMKNLRLRVESSHSERPVVLATLEITNTGNRAGAEVVQVYVGEKSPKVHRPKQELRAFEKVFLNPGETRTVKLKLMRDAFAYYDIEKSDWAVNTGRYSVRVGSSSRALPLEAGLELTEAPAK